MELRDKSPVFIVDDDSLYLKVLKHKLSNDSTIDVRIFEKGESCIENLKMNPEIVLLDYNLNSDNPRAKSGLEVLQEIKAVSPQTKVVMVSGYDNIDYVVNSFKLGASDYILKNALAPGKIQTAIHRLINKIHHDSEERSYHNGVKLMLMITGAIFAASVIIQVFFPRLFDK